LIYKHKKNSMEEEVPQEPSENEPDMYRYYNNPALQRSVKKIH
jgi:hypothetical protein